MALSSKGNGTTFQRRIDPGGFSVFTPGPANAAPMWVRLVRSANQFTAYASTDGVKWTTIGTDTVPMGSGVYIGLAVTSHDVSSKATAAIDQFKLSQTSAPPNQPPVVSVTAPTGGSKFTAPANITVTAQASDPENRLSRVDFFAGSTKIGSLTAAPFTITWSAVPAGTYALTAVAFDLDGGSTTSVPVTIDVWSAPNQNPTVGLSSPSPGATFSAPATIAIAASAADPTARSRAWSSTPARRCWAPTRRRPIRSPGPAWRPGATRSRPSPTTTREPARPRRRFPSRSPPRRRCRPRSAFRSRRITPRWCSPTCSGLPRWIGSEYGDGDLRAESRQADSGRQRRHHAERGELLQRAGEGLLHRDGECGRQRRKGSQHTGIVHPLTPFGMSRGGWPPLGADYELRALEGPQRRVPPPGEPRKLAQPMAIANAP